MRGGDSLCTYYLLTAMILYKGTPGVEGGGFMCSTGDPCLHLSPLPLVEEV